MLGQRKICVAAMIALSMGLGSRTFADDSDRLADTLTERMAAMDCPGALVGIFPDNKPARELALGVADIKTKAPMTLDMHMLVGSVTKPFIGTVVLQLAQEGQLSLDDPVSKYVDGVPRGEEITLRMLGTNTSGLFNTIENKKFQFAIMADPAHLWTTDEILKYTWAEESYASPGEKFRYSNTNAVLLGLCIEKVTGKKYSEILAERIFFPLGMKNTGVAGAAGIPEPRSSAYRHGYPDKVIGYGDVFYDVSNYSASWTNAAGNLYSTLADLGRAVRPLATGELLGEEGKAVLHDWLDTGHDSNQYGFLIGKRGPAIGHAGDVPGYNAYASYFVDHDVAVVVLTNLSNNKDGTMPAEELAEVVTQHIGITD